MWVCDRVTFGKIFTRTVFWNKTIFYFGLTIVWIGVSIPVRSKALTPSPFILAKPPPLPPLLNLLCQCCIFSQCPLYIGLSWIPCKARIFWLIPKILKFFSFTPTYLLKVTNFLLKILQFEFLVTTEESIVGHNFFFSLNISDLSLFFAEKLQPLLKKVTHLFPSKYPLKTEVCSTSSFWKYGKRLIPLVQQKREGRCTLCSLSYFKSKVYLLHKVRKWDIYLFKK